MKLETVITVNVRDLPEVQQVLREYRELMLLAASDLESWMKSCQRDAATEATVKRLRDAALGDASATERDCNDGVPASSIQRMSWDHKAGCMKADPAGPFVCWSDISTTEHCSRCNRDVDRACVTNSEAAECRTAECAVCGGKGSYPNSAGGWLRCYRCLPRGVTLARADDVPVVRRNWSGGVSNFNPEPAHAKPPAPAAPPPIADVQTSEVELLRAEQVAGVMPQIGPLLDAWDGMDNDTKAGLREDAPDLAKALAAIGRSMDLPNGGQHD